MANACKPNEHASCYGIIFIIHWQIVLKKQLGCIIIHLRALQCLPIYYISVKLCNKSINIASYALKGNCIIIV